MFNKGRAKLVAVHDGTEFKRVQDALRSSEAEFRTLVETMPQIVWVTRPDGWHIDFNQHWLDYTGLTVEESLGHGWNPPFHPDDRGRAAERWLQATNSGKPYEIEYRLRRRDGVYHWMLGRALPMRDAEGNIVKWFGTCTDIDHLKRTQERLDEAQLVGKIGDWEYNPITDDTTWSQAVYRMFGRDSRLDAPKNLLESSTLYDAESAVLLKKMLNLATASGQTQRFDLRTKGGDGQESYVQVVAVPRKADSGEVVGLFGTVQDISERKQAELALHARAQQQRLAAALGQFALSATSLDEVYTEAASTIAQGLKVEFSNILLLDGPQNPLVLKAGIGWKPGWIGRQVADPVEQTQTYRVLASREPVIIHDFSEDSQFAPSELLTSHGVMSGVDILVGGFEKPAGVLGAYTDTPRKFSTDDVGFLQGIANILSAVAERQRANEQLSHMALHDPLTDLPNRLLLTDRLNEALSHAKRHDEQVALLFVDIDRFKHVNDVFGHALGDHVLHEVAKRLSRCVNSEGTVSRQGGDEFIVALTGVQEEQDAALIADRLLTAITSPFILEDIEIILGMSIGIACFPRNGEDAGTLLRNADAAMYVAKELGRNRYQFYAPEMNMRALDRLTLESDLHRAIERNELFLMYQPQLDLKTENVVGLEALVRWRHPSRGLISPGQFIPIAEDCGLIIPIGNWILESACTRRAYWASQGLTTGSMAVNISAHQFRQADFCDRINDVLLRTGLRPDLLELEVTEGVIMQGIDQVLNKLNLLRELGVTLAIDDFGTGYSSLNYLKQFPLHCLKIDQSFTRGLPNDQGNEAIAKAIIQMGHSLGLKVLAEGIETKEEENHLKALGCDAGQGYLYAKPLSTGDCEEYLRVTHRD
ncbi:sensor domain-containing protein [Marinobacter orientalis]|uniref:cyclic-guanylate-specific phosphodiesterase n=1 Tax=Marinobacter orientalis TaxID=1928859 RepID=A0A7Y0REK2_9GAMM|nr:EAL domain-containing protein [Marinobacter orientalis]NMT64815.1 EAL domain-containing protein [Marinobacter orientalis]TGX48806.1 EAL domain-containing protein [Marinobacter orientalis]